MQPDGMIFVRAATHETIFFDLEKACEYVVSPPLGATPDIPAAFVILALVIQLADTLPDIQGWQLARLYEELFKAAGGGRIGFEDASGLTNRIERFKAQADYQLEDAVLSPTLFEEWADHLALSFVPALAKCDKRVAILGTFEKKMSDLVGPQPVANHVIEVLRAVC